MRWAAAMFGLTSLGVAQAATCDLTADSADRAGPGCARAWMDANLRLNDLLMVGTHNSYKEAEKVCNPVRAVGRCGDAEIERIAAAPGAR